MFYRIKQLAAAALCAVVLSIPTSGPAQAIDLETALWHYNNRDWVSAFLDFQILAAEGDVTAMTYMGRMYREGLAVQKNFEEAGKWLTRATEGGNAEAAYILGWMFAKNEIGPERDMTSATKHWKFAAERGYGMAQQDLGIMYWRGEGGVPVDLVRAHAWLSIADRNGIPVARGNLERLVTFMTAEQISNAERLAEQLVKDLEART